LEMVSISVLLLWVPIFAAWTKADDSITAG
jgi:hypothetical protein